jgi:UDP-N-acetylmuramoyl-L-alanyl-D-glutamate--2,6-diaminopimelate ligase
MDWSQAIARLQCLNLSGRSDVTVRGVQYDSRRVSSGDIFVAMRGETSDGSSFIDAAIRQGAVAIVTDSPDRFAELNENQPELAVALVQHGRRALAEVSSKVFGSPERVLKLCAITGTNGKTTVAYLLEQILRAAGRKCVLLGTIETHVGDEVRASEHTTPESRDVLAIFADGVRAGCTEAVMEMSSHALEQERVWGMPVDVAVFTNLTQDHLDYHGTMQHYAAAKAKIFSGVGTSPPRVAILNADDEYAQTMLDAARAAGSTTIWTYGCKAAGNLALDRPAALDLSAEDIALRADGTSFTLRASAHGVRKVESKLAGRVNVYNLLAAMGAALARGVALDDVLAAVETLKPAPGRFEVVQGSREAGFTVVVDYAHTDDALRNLLMLAHDLVGAGKVITVFGCGGDRDKTKRPKMGREAAASSDLVVVTSDNPRSEDPMAIIGDVMAGVREEMGMFAGQFVVEPDRRAAIEIAIRAAKPGDIVVLAGKGHEKTQIFADGAVPFDDVQEAARVLRDLKDGVVA